MQINMNNDIKPKILLIIAMGVAIFAMGMALFAFTKTVGPYMRYLLPLPPISVAAYMYVLNKLAIAPSDPTVKGERRALIQDVLTELLVGVIVFFVLCMLMIAVLHTVPDSIRSDATKEKILLIAIMGLAMMVAGAFLYANVKRVASHWRFLLPLPPISVAAYIYVLNRSGEANALAGSATIGEDVQDLLVQTFVGTLCFSVVVTLILLAFALLMRQYTSTTNVNNSKGAI